MITQRIISLKSPNGIAAYELYKRSFPLNEQRIQSSQKSIMKNPLYHFDLIFADNKWVGEILYWEADDFLYVEHFCICEKERGNGYGAEALSVIASQGKSVILEIDPPEDDVSIRRKGFYEKNGFVKNDFSHIHPAYRKRFDGHKLVVMSYPNALSRYEYDEFYRFLCNSVMN
ncbi:MAG TPA: N-acetyltransferase [Clostridiales bacterium]|nr:N-acetyltransferase [Clostridiales bacterium]